MNCAMGVSYASVVLANAQCYRTESAKIVVLLRLTLAKKEPVLLLERLGLVRNYPTHLVKYCPSFIDIKFKICSQNFTQNELRRNLTLRTKSVDFLQSSRVNKTLSIRIHGKFIRVERK